MATIPEVSMKDLVIWDDQRSMCCGYLNKKASKSSAFSKGKYQKRWFSINIDIEANENYVLSYSHNADDKAKQSFPLINASVKLAGGNNFVISFVDDTILTLSADNSEVMKKWIDTLENVIKVANQREKVLQTREASTNNVNNKVMQSRSAQLLRGESLASRSEDAHHGGVSSGGGRSHGRKKPQALNVNDNEGDSEHSPLSTKSPVRAAVMTHHPALRLDIDVNTIPPSSTSRHQFLELFMEDISAALEIIPGLIEIISVKPAPGMDWLTMVQFDIISSAIPVEDMSNPEYAEEVAAEQDEIRDKLLWTLSEMVADTSSRLYHGFVTSKLDPSFCMNMRNNYEDNDEDFVPFSTDTEVMEIMERYKSVSVPTNELDITHFTIQLHFENKVVPLKVPNPLVLKKRNCVLWPFEVKQALGFMGTMQELWIEPTALIPKDMPKLLSQPIPFEPSIRYGGEALINASRLTGDQSYEVQVDDRRDEALNALSPEEMDEIKATFQQFDINGDGGISHSEMLEIVRQRTQERKAIIEQRYQSYISEPGITTDEIEAAEYSKAQYLQSVQEAQSKMVKIFEAADIDGDGVISFTEFIMAEAWWLRCTINPDRAHLF